MDTALNTISDEQLQALMHHRNIMQNQSKNYCTVEDYPVLDDEKTKKYGRVVYNMVPYIKIKSRDKISFTEIHRPWKDTDKIEYAFAWAEYKNTIQMTGTPLSHWPYADKDFIMEMKAINIKTVKDLVELTDERIEFIGGEKIKDFVKAAKLYDANESILQGKLDDALAEIKKLKASPTKKKAIKK